ncbi:hypothetical protein GY45DRAFT_865329 [Cubamyces sp. BRFM 1775]|nr:hypothetical protein GY45DRAFT_865329 [Cubamyces sp. BRFM 1775]
MEQKIIPAGTGPLLKIACQCYGGFTMDRKPYSPSNLLLIGRSNENSIQSTCSTPFSLWIDISVLPHIPSHSFTRPLATHRQQHGQRWTADSTSTTSRR